MTLDENFFVERGAVRCGEGIPQMPRWFTDSRLAFSLEEHSVTEVAWYEKNCGTVFMRHLWDGFRYYIEQDGLNYRPVYRNTVVRPWGVEAEWPLEDHVFSHKVLAVDETMVFELTAPADLPPGCRFKFDFNTAFALSYSDRLDFRHPTGPGREWKEWAFDPDGNVLVGGYRLAETEFPQAYDFCCVFGADFPMEYRIDEKGNVHVLTGPELQPGQTCRLMISFARERERAMTRNRAFIEEADEKIGQQYERYRQLADSVPRLRSPYQDLNRYFELLPHYHESLKVTDIPGAVRAKTWRYWVWGWDGMTNNSATAYWGDTRHIGDMLDFYRETADPEGGIVHWYEYDMSIKEVSMVPAQCIYLVLLQLYADQTADLEQVRKNYDFAVRIYRMAAATEVGESGMTQGQSLFPDYRDLIGETGDDISALNNSIFYCASRSMNRLAALMGDEAVRQESARFAERMEAGFMDRFFDTEKGFPVSSLEASTGRPREVFQMCSLRWENDYYYDLVRPVMERCMDFVETHLVCRSGIREVPRWCPAYGADANQLQAWWPVADESFVRMANALDRKDLLERWVGWLEYWYGQLSCPEAVSCHIETDRPETDRWSALKGAWQAFAMRTWYQGIVHGVVGVDADAGGITFHPYSGEEMVLEGLHYLGKTFDFSMQGSGPFIETLEVGGRTVRGTNKLPLECYQDKNHVAVTVRRVAEPPYPLMITRGNGAVLKDYQSSGNQIETRLQGAGLVRLELWAESMPEVRLNGSPVSVEYDADSKGAIVALELEPDGNEQLHISMSQGV
ncbi:hypothetical protein PDESU_04840 [Pontiella desulfatans]|uniref:Alpha-L-rhamnosidase six-hairpin glycosidase domain-containing protein n=1 Tax=Pontiella desulfatans TaxID=2750659 RepID=A0A6C2U8P6_PONDE|nr:hypothetical protein [Pontiella desulfatans]VGO16249.1 hypothetical protein PDESU_04840 [Pontiella desulfatans]